MDFQSAMETFAEAWVAANAGQQSQALALTRAANAAAAAAAAVNSAKSPTANLNDMSIKKEHHQHSSNSPTHINNNNNGNSNNNSTATTTSAMPTTTTTNTMAINAQSSSCSSPNDESSMNAHQQQQQQHHLHHHQHQQQRRRPSLQGVSEKLTQLQMQQHNQQQQHHHHHQQQQQQQTPLHHHHQQQQQQSDIDERSSRYGSNSSAGRRSTDGGIGSAVSPAAVAVAAAAVVGDIERSLGGNLSNSASSSQNPSLSATPKLCERGDERANTAAAAAAAAAVNTMVGSITCLPPSALNAVGSALSGLAAAGQQSQQHQSQVEKLLTSPAGIGSSSLEHSSQQQQQQQQRRDFDISKVNSKSLPLHCVVESVHSLQASLTIDMRNPWKRRPNIETDSYVIIAASTPFSEIVQTALQRLGYTQETASTARGSLIIKNWKPIPLEQISDNPVVPVCDIIGELTSVVTLRIVILRTKPSPFGEIKDKLLKLLVLQSHAVLRSTGCPLDEVTLSQICRSSYQNSFAFPGGEISEDLRRKFDQWWSNQLSPQASITPKMLPFMAAPPNVPNEMDFPAVAAAAAAAAAAQAGLHVAASANVPPGIGVPSAISASRESLLLNESAAHHAAGGVPGGGSTPHHHAANMLVHPAMHASMHHHHHHPHTQYPNQKTRMRTSFDPEMELPKLQKWFQENPHPSRQQIQTYVVQLNALDSRRGRKPLDVNNVVYWFKNARAAQKRAEMRGGLGPIGLSHVAMNGYLGQHTQLGQNSSSSTGSMNSGQQLVGGVAGNMSNLTLSHDYLKSPLSLKSEDIDTMSQHSDDMDEDQSRPGSPQLPLSLTTHERNRNTPDDDENDDERDMEQGTTRIKSETENRDLPNGAASSNPTGERTRTRNFDNDDDDDEDDEGGDNKHDKESNANSERQTQGEHDNATRNTPQHADNESNKCSPNPHNTTNSNSNNNNSNANGNGSGSGSGNGNVSAANVNVNSNQSHEHQMSFHHTSSSTPKHQQQHTSPKEEDDELDMDEDDDENENDTSQLDEFRSPSPTDITNAVAAAQRKELPFPMVPNSMFSQSFMYMSHYMPGFGQAAAAAAAHPHAHHAAAAAAAAGMQQNALMNATGLGSLSSLSSEERRKRNRTFIDPVTEVPKLEQWFAMNTHPSHNLILKYTEDLNQMPYRQKFPRLESKNVQFWFKNRRAKCKRLKMSLYDNSQCSQLAGLNSFVHKYDD